MNIERHLDILEEGTILELEQCRLGSITQVKSTPKSVAVQLNLEGRLDTTSKWNKDPVIITHWPEGFDITFVATNCIFC